MQEKLGIRADRDADLSWSRSAAALRASRAAWQRVWGEVDDPLMARYLSGRCSEEERQQVRSVMERTPEIRECAELSQEALMSDIQAIPFRPERTQRSWAASRPRWAGMAAASAASLLLGVMIGALGVLGPGGGTAPTRFFASATPIIKGTRGESRDLKIEIRSDLDGFATVVALTPGQRQQVLPGLGGDPVRVRPGVSVTTNSLPPGAAKATVAVVVVTETPNDAVVRRVLRDRDFTPDQADQLASMLEVKLREDNYRRMAMTRLSLEVTPK